MVRAAALLHGLGALALGEVVAIIACPLVAVVGAPTAGAIAAAACLVPSLTATPLSLARVPQIGQKLFGKSVMILAVFNNTLLRRQVAFALCVVKATLLHTTKLLFCKPRKLVSIVGEEIAFWLYRRARRHDRWLALEAIREA